MSTGLRVWNCELSTIDTGLLMAGALFCQSYFDSAAPANPRFVDWLTVSIAASIGSGRWTERRASGLAWYPGRGFVQDTWTGYDDR